MELEPFFVDKHNIQPKVARTRVIFDLPAEQELADTVWRAARTHRNKAIKQDRALSLKTSELILMGHVDMAEIDAAVAAQPGHDTLARRATASRERITPNPEYL